MQRYFRIGELSQLYGIGTDTIRYYEELGLISPVREQNGYRMYSIKDIWRMNVIRDLRALGFSMGRIREYLEERSVDKTLELLRSEQSEIEKQMDKLRHLQSSVKRRLAALESAQAQTVGEVERINLPPRSCHEIYKAFCTDEEMDVLTKQLLNRLHNRLYIIGNNFIGCRLSPAAVRQGDYHAYESVFFIAEEDEAARGVLPGGEYLRVRYRGSSRQNDDYVPLLFREAERLGLELAGEVLELVLIDIHEAADYKEHLTELQARVAQKA